MKTAVIPTANRRFLVADLNARGELRARQDYAYSELEQLPAAADLIAGFSTAIWRSPEEFEHGPLVPGTRVDCRWLATSDTTGLLSLRCEGELGTFSLLISGKDKQSDEITIAAFQRHLLQMLHDTGFEPAFDLLQLSDRPLLATMALRSPAGRADQATIALADRCFAASFFRYQGLV